MTSDELTPESLTRRWEVFSASILAVLGGSLLAVAISAVAVATSGMAKLLRDREAGRAEALATYLAQEALVPATLEDVPGLDKLAEGTLGDPDLASVEIAVRGRVVVSRSPRAIPPSAARVEASRPIGSPTSGFAARTGSVRVILSGERNRAALHRMFRRIVAGCAVLLALAIALDVALIVRMTRHLRGLIEEAQQAKDLRQSNQDLEQFAFIASHDLQEPLRKVVSYCQLLERRYRADLPPEAGKMIGVIVGGARRMSELIRDLLTYSRVGRSAEGFEPVSLDGVVRDVLDALKPAIQEAKAVVTCAPLPEVMGRPYELGQLYLNLIGNAVKFHGERPPEVTVDARQDGGRWVFRVKDNGIGIAPSDHKRIFEMFKRVNPRGRIPGTGIGLAVCAKAVARHGGRIWVESELGRGASFYFTLSGDKS